MLVHSERRGRVVPTHYPPAPSEVAVLLTEALLLGEGREYSPHCHARMHLRARIKSTLVPDAVLGSEGNNVTCYIIFMPPPKEDIYLCQRA